MRKEKKVAKKERIKHYFKNQTQQYITQPQPQLKHKPQPAKKAEKVKKESKIQKLAKSVELEEDEKIIKMYESKLGVKQGKDKYKKMAKDFGLDNDLFNFLDQISSKVTQPASKQPQQPEDLNEEDVNEEEIDEEELS